MGTMLESMSWKVVARGPMTDWYSHLTPKVDWYLYSGPKKNWYLNLGPKKNWYLNLKPKENWYWNWRWLFSRVVERRGWHHSVRYRNVRRDWTDVDVGVSPRDL